MQSVGTAMTSPLPVPPAPAPQLGAARTSRRMGPREAAILLVSIGDENCAGILRRLPEDEVHQVTREISRLGTVADEERNSVLESFGEAVGHARLFDCGGLEYAQSVLIAAFGPEAGKRIAERVLKSLGAENVHINSLQK